MLDLRKLQTFRVAAATRNFTRAAAELGCCQSSVTVHIKALEDELGVPLFERCRSSRTVILTAVGRQTLEYASRLLTLAEEAKAAIHSAATPV
jgi:DNA-binding transcriptional LysR family regulator